MKTKNKKMSIIIMGICAVLLCVLGVSIYHLTKKDNNNEADYYLYINEDLVKDTYYYGEDFEFAQNMNIATLCKKESSSTVYASSLSDGKNKKGQEIDNKDLVVEGFDSETSGKKAVRIKYKDYYKIIEVDVKNCSITSINVINESNLFVGEKVDKLNLCIEYSDGYITYDEYNTHLGIDTSTAGIKTKEIYYPSYNFTWQYLVMEFDEECFESDINIEGNLFPLGYKANRSVYVKYKDTSSEASRSFGVNVEINCETLGEKTTDIIIKKSDIFNDSNISGEIVIPYTYTVDNAISITLNSYYMKKWRGLDDKLTYISLIALMNNGEQFKYSIPVETTDEYNALGEHSYPVSFAGQTTTYNYTVVDIESVETYNWEDVYYYSTQKERILENYTVAENSQPIISTPSVSQPSERIDKFSSLNENHEFIEGLDYSGLDMPNILSNYELILNSDLYTSKKLLNIINSGNFVGGGNLVFVSNIFYRLSYYQQFLMPIKVNYSNGESEVVLLTELNNIKFEDKIIDCGKLGEHTISFNYYGKTFDYTYQVKQLDSIEVLNVDKVYANNIPTNVEIKIKAKDGTFNYTQADVIGGIVKGKKMNLCFEYLDNYYEYSTSSVAIVELVCKDKLEFVKSKYIENKTLQFTVKYEDNTQEDIRIDFDSTQIDTSKPVRNAKLTFKYFGKNYTFKYDVLDYEFEVKEEYKTIYQGQPYNEVEFLIKYSNGTSTSRTYTFENNNKIDTSVDGTFNIFIYQNEDVAFTYELTILPLVDAKLICSNRANYVLGDDVQVQLSVLDSSDKVLYTVYIDEYLDTFYVSDNIERTFTYLDMSCDFNYEVLDIGVIRFTSKRIYYVGEELKSLDFEVVSKSPNENPGVSVGNLILNIGSPGYKVSLKPEDLGDFDITKSELGVNKITFNHCGYEIEFVYYYGEKGSVELQENTFVIERTAENRVYSLSIPMLITIGDYQFIDNSAVRINNINTKDAGTYTYKFMYDDQEFEITYTIVDAE